MVVQHPHSETMHQQHGSWPAHSRHGHEHGHQQARPMRRGNDDGGTGDDVSRSGGNGTGGMLDRALGWLSLALGVGATAMPEQVTRLVGVRSDNDSRALVRIAGVREIGTGLGLLSGRGTRYWLGARAAGDVMDLTLLSLALTRPKTRRGRIVSAMAAVAGLMALDTSATVSHTRKTQARPSQVRRAITVNRSPDEVYRFWHDFENLPRFMSHLESVRVTGDGRSHWTARAPGGTTFEWDAEVVEDRPGSLIAWRSLPGSEVESAGAVHFVPAPGKRGTEVHLDMAYTPPGGVLGSTAALFGRVPEELLESDLRAFKQIMETGEVVQSDASIHRLPHPAQPPEHVPTVR